MATGTLGTAATTSLVSLVWNPMSAIADIATIAANIKGQSGIRPISPGAFANNGRLHFPGHRGFILLNPGDYVAYDNWNWPIVVSSQSIASGSSWSHNP
jgi:hypothetical protein